MSSHKIFTNSPLLFSVQGQGKAKKFSHTYKYFALPNPYYLYLRAEGPAPGGAAVAGGWRRSPGGRGRRGAGGGLPGGAVAWWLAAGSSWGRGRREAGGGALLAGRRWPAGWRRSPGGRGRRGRRWLPGGAGVPVVLGAVFLAGAGRRAAVGPPGGRGGRGLAFWFVLPGGRGRRASKRWPSLGGGCAWGCGGRLCVRLPAGHYSSANEGFAFTRTVFAGGHISSIFVFYCFFFFSNLALF